jgi:beta-lactamase regulating signal transducer with metallopeptidase domain
MRVSFLISLFREDIVRALLWTLVHSLWQGLALAILTGLAILFTRRAASVWRYHIFLGLMGLFITAAILTFLLELRSSVVTLNSAAVSGGVFNDRVAADIVFAVAPSAGGEQSWDAQLTIFFNQHANLIIAIWFVILAMRLIKLVTDLWTVHRLRHYNTSSPDMCWVARVGELAHKIGIKRTVRILESTVVKTPMMAGLMKPVILTPLGMLADLQLPEVEAILLHELAHIRRNDYLINIIQSFAEILFFFNPAVLWLSALIREERENCCDDIAVGETHSKKDLVTALVSFQEFSHSRHALAFAGKREHLLRRVRRIVHSDDRTLNKREKIFVLISLFITTGLTMAYTYQTPSLVKTVKTQTIWQAPAVEDVTLRGEFRSGSAAKAIGAVKQRGPKKLQDLVHAIQIVADTSKKPQSLKDSADEERDRQWDLMLEQQYEELKLQRMKLDEEQFSLDKQLRILEVNQAKLKLLSVQLIMDSMPSLLLGKELDKLRLAEAQARVDMLNHQDIELLAKNQRQLRENQLRIEGLARLQAEKLGGLENKLDTTKLELVQSADQVGKLGNSHDGIIKPFLRMLMEKQMISQMDDVSFSLDNKVLFVNGVRQPKEVFESFRKEFLHSSQDYIKYSKHKGSEMSSINMHDD